MELIDRSRIKLSSERITKLVKYNFEINQKKLGNFSKILFRLMKAKIVQMCFNINTYLSKYQKKYNFGK